MASENIEGTATDANGNALNDAVIAVFLTNKNATDGSTNTVKYTTTDSNGNYVIKDHPDADGSSQEWHVAGYYQDGTGEFNALSKPSVAASVGAAIPDSAIHRWKFGEGSGTNIGDSVGSADGTLSTDAMWTSGTWVGDNALVGDGNDDNGNLTQLGTFGSSMDTDFTILVTLKTTDSTGEIAGVRTNTRQRLRLNIGDAGDGLLRLFISDENDAKELIKSDSRVDDGTKRRLAFVKSTNEASNFKIYSNASEMSTTVEVSDGLDTTAFSDFSHFLATHAVNQNGSVSDYLNGTLDNLIVCDSALTTTEIQADYDRQPWN